MPRVLIVDDDDDIRLLTRLQIEKANDGLTVAGVAADGAEAIRLWRDTVPDVIVLDYLMPGLSGLDVADAILTAEPAQAIILYTAAPDHPDLRSAVEHGVRSVVNKTEPSRLISALRALGGVAPDLDAATVEPMD